MVSEIFALGLGVLVILIVVLSCITFSTENTDSSTYEIMAIEDDKQDILTEDTVLEIFCLSSKRAISDGDYFDVRLNVNTGLNTCDLYLKPYDYDARELCEEVLLRTSMDGTVECIPVKGLFCNNICDGANTE